MKTVTYDRNLHVARKLAALVQQQFQMGKADYAQLQLTFYNTLASAYPSPVAERPPAQQQQPHLTVGRDGLQHDAASRVRPEAPVPSTDSKDAPPPGLLMSMALRYDHGLGMPGYYDSGLVRTPGVSHARRLESTLGTMLQLWEEVTGNGFYRPEKEAEYVAMRDAALAVAHERGGGE